jgi:hypothetical protein
MTSFVSSTHKCVVAHGCATFLFFGHDGKSFKVTNLILELQHKLEHGR